MFKSFEARLKLVLWPIVAGGLSFAAVVTVNAPEFAFVIFLFSLGFTFCLFAPGWVASWLLHGE